VSKENKGLTVADTKKEFDRQLNQLKKEERNALAWEKVTLFLRAIDKRFRKELKLLHEDPGTEDGITNDWATVTNGCSKLTKRIQRRSSSFQAYRFRRSIG
jgi:hypothetical protein